jgi:5'(3')-deoxyribonucleotidase
VDKSCGIHCHLDMSQFNARQVSNLVRYFYKYEDYLMAALKINPQRARTYAKPIRQEVIRKIERHRPTNLRELNTIWYGYYNSHPTHYDSSRYYV